MILQTATNYLATHVENGSCIDAAVVKSTINEAQRRLYHKGDWIGTVYRWGVTVDNNGEFSTPSNCEIVQRVSVLADGLQHSVAGTVVATNADAFVFDSPSILRFQQIAPNKYRINGPYPTAVDVMGKITYKDAVNQTDSMIIDDLDALKLMVLAIWRENNNAPDLAADLINKAIEHLTTKTQLSVETAKSALWMNQLQTATPGTRGYARVKAALSINGGDRRDDARIAMLVDDAEKRLMSRLSMVASYLFKAVGGYITFPREIERILRIDINNCPMTLNSQTYEFLGYGTGYKEDTYDSRQVIYRGEFALQADMPRRSKLTVITSGKSRGIKIFIEGKLGNDNITETLQTNGGSIATTEFEYDDVTSITTQPRDGSISIIVDDTEVAFMQPYDTDSKRARYAIPSDSNCKEMIVRVLARPRWIQKIRDEQRMQIENEQAITMMAASIELERAGKFQESITMADLAVKLVNDELMHANMGHSVKIDKTRSGMTLKKANTWR